MKRVITPRQAAFCENIIKGMPYDAAYIAAGYSPKAVRQKVWHALQMKAVKEYLAELREQQKIEVAEMSREYVLGQLRIILDSTQSACFKLKALNQIARVMGYETQKIQVLTSVPIFQVLPDKAQESND